MLDVDERRLPAALEDQAAPIGGHGGRARAVLLEPGGGVVGVE